MKVFHLVEYFEHEGDSLVGIFSTVEKARAIYDADLAAPYGERRQGELRCFAVLLDVPIDLQPFEQIF